MKGIIKRRQGISLIVLVITIIIMIILATAVILSLSSSDIVSKAKQAKSNNDIANAKELVATAYAEWMLNQNGSFSAYAEQKLIADGYPASGTGSIEVTEDGTVYQYPTIPAGFTVSSITGETTVAGGLVIYEGTTPVDADNANAEQTTRNQFVWVPVEGGWQAGHDWGKGDITFPDVKEGKTPPQEQLDSINMYGGFYIARYEAGKPTGSALTGGTTTNLDIDGTDKPVSIKGANVWNNIPWDNTWVEGETYGEPTNPGCALVASKAYERSSSVTSSLMYGAQWDAALSFISKTNDTYATNSTGMGWYEQGDPTTTGSNTDYAINNIYDMAGNVWECTYEAFTNGDSGLRVVCGGCYGDNGTSTPASFRSCSLPNYAAGNCGFRTVLFLK